MFAQIIPVETGGIAPSRPDTAYVGQSVFPRRIPYRHGAVFLQSLITIQLLVVALPSYSNAQCQPQWRSDALAGATNGPVHCLTQFDGDGLGPESPALYVGGDFTAAGQSAANNIARWDARLDGAHWSPLGLGLNGPALTMVVFDEDGDGPRSPALFVGGSFTMAGGVLALSVIEWDGSSTELSAGLLTEDDDVLSKR